jgi:uncharacterized spore protein YtfJ
MTTEIDTSTFESSGTRVDALIQRIAEKLGATVKASTVFGDPVERDGLTVIPVARARWGFGGGGGTGQPERGADGGGGGGAMSITPVGYIEIGDGQTRFRPIQDARRFLPYVFGATALLMLSVRLLDRRPSLKRTTWKGLRR